MKYILVDTANLFFRVRHTAHRNADLSDKLGLSIHIILSSVTKAIKLFNVDHVVFMLEGRSWRKSIYEPYKKQRAEQRQARTEAEIEEDELFWEYYNDLTKYLEENTKATILQEPNAEADDLIARWIKLHPDDEHIILSSDSDFYQLLSSNVLQYNGITKELITIDGVFTDDMTPVIDKKTQEPKKVKDPEWLLFEKCIRGDVSDNIFSAYPGVRVKSTKNKVGLMEAFEDRDKKGFAWNNLMLQRWTDHNGNEHRVLDDYERNKLLIDLNAQPEEIKNAIDDAIFNAIHTDRTKAIKNSEVNFKFMKFCAKHDLVRLAEYPQDHIAWMIKGYPGELKNITTEQWHSWKNSKQNQL